MPQVAASRPRFTGFARLWRAVILALYLAACGTLATVAVFSFVRAIWFAPAVDRQGACFSALSRSFDQLGSEVAAVASRTIPRDAALARWNAFSARLLADLARTQARCGRDGTERSAALARGITDLTVSFGMTFGTCDAEPGRTLCSVRELLARPK